MKARDVFIGMADAPADYRGHRIGDEKVSSRILGSMQVKPAHNALTPERGWWANLDGRRVRNDLT